MIFSKQTSGDNSSDLLPSPAWVRILGGAVIAFLVLPCLIVIPTSFSPSRFLTFPPDGFSVIWYQEFFNSALWGSASSLSLQVAVMSVLLSVPIGFCAAYGIHQCRPLLARLGMSVFLLPLIVPQIFMAIGIFLVFSRIGLNNTVIGLLLAHTLLAMPLVIICVLGGLQRFDQSMELAARNLGANRLRAVLTVTVPQIRSYVVTGAIFAFFTSFDEVIIALFVSSGPRSTLPRRMFANIRDQIEPTIAAVSSLLIFLTLVGLTLVLVWGKWSRVPQR